MIISKCDENFLIKIFKDSLEEFNIFDIESIKELFQDVFKKMTKKWDLHGFYDADVYVNNDYGMIIELVPVNSYLEEFDNYFDEVDIRINVHLSNEFLVLIDSNSILDYEDVYYYDGKFYGAYLGNCDNEVLYKDTDLIVNNGIKIC